MLGWRDSGFSVHNQVSVAANDAEGRKKLAGYMLRAPLSLAKMSYDVASGTVIYCSEMHLGLKRNFQVMPAPSGWSCFASIFPIATSNSSGTWAGTRAAVAGRARRRAQPR